METSIKVLEAQIRQLFAGVVWTHKIQEKQADIYKNKNTKLEMAKVFTTTLTTSGILASLFINERALTIGTAIVSFLTILLNELDKSCNYKELQVKYKSTALELLSIREEWICLLTDIKTERVIEEEVIIRRDQIMDKQMKIYKIAADASSKAVAKASEALKANKDNTFEDDEIDSFLPKLLRKNN